MLIAFIIQLYEASDKTALKYCLLAVLCK